MATNGQRSMYLFGFKILSSSVTASSLASLAVAMAMALTQQMTPMTIGTMTCPICNVAGGKRQWEPRQWKDQDPMAADWSFACRQCIRSWSIRFDKQLFFAQAQAINSICYLIHCVSFLICLSVFCVMSLSCQVMSQFNLLFDSLFVISHFQFSVSVMSCHSHLSFCNRCHVSCCRHRIVSILGTAAQRTDPGKVYAHWKAMRRSQMKLRSLDFISEWSAFAGGSHQRVHHDGFHGNANPECPGTGHKIKAWGVLMLLRSEGPLGQLQAQEFDGMTHTALGGWAEGFSAIARPELAEELHNFWHQLQHSHVPVTVTFCQFVNLSFCFKKMFKNRFSKAIAIRIQC